MSHGMSEHDKLTKKAVSSRHHSLDDPTTGNQTLSDVLTETNEDSTIEVVTRPVQIDSCDIKMSYPVTQNQLNKLTLKPSTVKLISTHPMTLTTRNCQTNRLGQSPIRPHEPYSSRKLHRFTPGVKSKTRIPKLTSRRSKMKGLSNSEIATVCTQNVSYNQEDSEIEKKQVLNQLQQEQHIFEDSILREEIELIQNENVRSLQMKRMIKEERRKLDDMIRNRTHYLDHLQREHEYEQKKFQLRMENLRQKLAFERKSLERRTRVKLQEIERKCERELITKIDAEVLNRYHNGMESSEIWRIRTWLWLDGLCQSTCFRTRIQWLVSTKG